MGGDYSGLCFLFLISLRLRTLVQWFSRSLFFKRNQAKEKTFMLSVCFLLGFADKVLGRRGQDHAGVESQVEP